jgi:solute carrier family 44 (choline transporter-like protein), member 2/4/5
MVLLYLMSVGTEVYKVSGMNKTTTCACTGATTFLDGDICQPEVFNQNCRVGSSRLVENYCIDAGCRFNHLDSPREVSYFHGMNVVGFFWVVCFITAFGEMVLAATFASWYWTFKKANVPFFTLTRGFARTIRLGSNNRILLFSRGNNALLSDFIWAHWLLAHSSLPFARSFALY